VSNEILAFDWGTTIVGILDVARNVYTSYRGKDMIEGAKRIASSTGTIVSFGGNSRDLKELSEILSFPFDTKFQGGHDDMSEIISMIRWPPDAGTAPILGQCLRDTYRHYFGDELPPQPAGIHDLYEVNNWRDCHMTAELWKKWKRQGL
jgi:hypothetical protein